MKKYIIMILLFIGIIGSIQFLKHYRLYRIFSDTLGHESYMLLNKKKEEIQSGIDGSNEVYIYSIQNVNKVNCQLLNKYKKNNFLNTIEDKYINTSNAFCSVKIEILKDKKIYITIQDKTLILSLFMKSPKNLNMD